MTDKTSKKEKSERKEKRSKDPECYYTLVHDEELRFYIQIIDTLDEISQTPSTNKKHGKLKDALKESLSIYREKYKGKHK